MRPVWALMLRPAGKVPEKVSVSPAAGAAKWLETFSEKAGPSRALWFAVGGAGDQASMGVDAEARRQLGREGQRIPGGGGREMTGDIEREGLAFVSALVCDDCGRRAAVTDGKIEAFADGFAVGVGGRHRDRVVAVVAVGWGPREDAGVGIDAEARRQLGRKGQGIAGGRGREVIRDIEREGLTLIGALVCDGGGSGTAVADLELEALANRFAVGVGRRHRDRVVAVVAVGRGAGDDPGMGVDAEASRQL